MGKTIGKIVTYLIVILLILGAIAAISFFAMRSQGVTFYVEHNGARYLANLATAAVCFYARRRRIRFP